MAESIVYGLNNAVQYNNLNIIQAILLKTFPHQKIDTSNNGSYKAYYRGIVSFDGW